MYNCKDNSLRVVYSLFGQGFAVVKGDGTVIECPLVAPDELSDECMAVMEEGYCEGANLCLGVTMPAETLPETTTTTEETTTTTQCATCGG